MIKKIIFHLLERGSGEQKNAKAAEVFFKCWKAAEGNETYQRRKLDWKKNRS